ncbi:MAG: enoyl-CoA hydratase [Pseudooceanicola sp.]
MIDLKTDKILADVRDGIGWLTFNQPEKRNAMSLEMWQGTADALDAFAADPDVRVVVMTGAGDRAFVSGADISQFEKNRSNAEQAEEYARISNGARERLANIEKPLIAKIRGFCIGGGLAVAMAADFRIAAKGSEFGIPAARMGLVYPYDAIRTLVSLVGPGMARRILYTGRRIPAEEALRIGLIEEVVEEAELDATVLDLATAMAQNAPLSMRGSKLIINQLMGRDRDIDEAAIERMSLEVMDSADYAEGRRAFMEKRQPRFTGK